MKHIIFTACALIATTSLFSGCTSSKPRRHAEEPTIKLTLIDSRSYFSDLETNILNSSFCEIPLSSRLLGTDLSHEDAIVVLEFLIDTVTRKLDSLRNINGLNCHFEAEHTKATTARENKAANTIIAHLAYAIRIKLAQPGLTAREQKSRIKRVFNETHSHLNKTIAAHFCGEDLAFSVLFSQP